MAYKMKGFSGFKPESVPDGEGEVNLSKSSGLGPRTSFGGSKNPELDKKAPTKFVRTGGTRHGKKSKLTKAINKGTQKVIEHGFTKLYNQAKGVKKVYDYLKKTPKGSASTGLTKKKSPAKSVPIAAVATAADMVKKKRGDTAKKLGKVSEGLKKAGKKMQNAAAERPSPAAGIAAAAASMNFSRKDSPAQMSDKKKLKKAERLDKKIAKSSKAGKSTSKRNLKRASKANKLRGY